MQKLIQKPAQLSMMIVIMVKLRQHAAHTLQNQEISIPIDVKSLADKYSKVFSIPIAFPPYRTHDHKIILKERTSPINKAVQISNYSKDEIEKQVQDMLDSGVIRTSVSPYSSPIVMVKKKDGS